MISMESRIIELAKGNPGAFTVLVELILINPLLLEILEELDIRGPQIWVAFKDWAKKDMNKLSEGIMNRDPEMIETTK